MLLEISQPASHVRIHANLRVKIFSITTPSKKYVKWTCSKLGHSAANPQLAHHNLRLSAELHQQQAYTNAWHGWWLNIVWWVQWGVGEDEWDVILFFYSKILAKDSNGVKACAGKRSCYKEHCCCFPCHVLATKSSDVLVCPKLPVYSTITVDIEDSKQAQQDRPKSKRLSRVRSRLASIIVQQAMSSSHANCGGTSLVCLRHSVCTGLSEGHPYLLISCHAISIIITHPHTVFLSLHW